MTEPKRGRFLQQNLEAAFPHFSSVRNGWILHSPAICGQRARPPFEAMLRSGQIPYERKP